MVAIAIAGSAKSSTDSVVTGGAVVVGVGSAVTILSAKSILDVETVVENEVTKVVGGLATVEVGIEYTSDIDESVVDEAIEIGVLDGAGVVIVSHVEVPEKADIELDRWNELAVPE